MGLSRRIRLSRPVKHEGDLEADDTYVEDMQLPNESEYTVSSRTDSISRSSSRSGRGRSRISVTENYDDTENYNDASNLQRRHSYSSSAVSSHAQGRSASRHRSSSTPSSASQHTSALGPFSSRSASLSSGSNESRHRRRRGIASRLLIPLLKVFLMIVVFFIRAVYKLIFVPLRSRLEYATRQLNRRLINHFTQLFMGNKSPSAKEKEAKGAKDKEAGKVQQHQTGKKLRRSDCVHIRRSSLLREFRPTSSLFREAIRAGSQLALIEALAEATARLCSIVGLPESEKNMTRLPQLFIKSQDVRKRKLTGEIGRTAQHEEMSKIWIEIRGIWREAAREFVKADTKHWYHRMVRPKGWDEEEAVQSRDAFSLYDSSERLKGLRLRKINYV